MADQQDQLSSGGSVETASASADTSKVRGKSSSSGSSGYRKRQSTGSIPITVEEKRRRQTIGDPQSSEVFDNTSCKHSSDSIQSESRSECKSHGSGLESYLDNNWRSQHKIQQSNYNISGNSTRQRSTARTSLPELNLTAVDCVASRTRSRTPQNPQAISQGHNSYNLSLSSGYNNKEDLSYNNLVPTSTTTPVTSHPSTSRGRGKCFRQRVSYLVHRRIHTGVMPYKCTICGKNFRYKVSQRTHKCPAQQIGNTYQTSTIDQKSINLSNIQDINNDIYKTQKHFLKENQSMLNIINNEENKYVLIINTQGQHLLTKESNIEKTITNKKQKLEECTETNNKNERTKNIWKSDIPNSSTFKKSLETCKTIYSKTEKPFQEDANDFFSMIILPVENGLSSPTVEMEHLRVSSPIQKEIISKPYETFRNAAYDMEMNIFNTDIEQNFSDKK